MGGEGRSVVVDPVSRSGERGLLSRTLKEVNQLLEECVDRGLDLDRNFPCKPIGPIHNDPIFNGV